MKVTFAKTKERLNDGINLNKKLIVHKKKCWKINFLTHTITVTNIVFTKLLSSTKNYDITVKV